MYRVLLTFALCFLFAGCASNMSVAKSNGKDDILSSREIFLASLFAANDSVPTSKKLVVNFADNKSSLTKKSKKLIDDFIRSILQYEEYEISVILSEDEQSPSGKPKNLSHKRAQSLFKAIIHSGADRDRIDVRFVGQQDNDEIKNDANSAAIEAEAW